MSTITVSSLAELNTALSGAQGGETILLEGGDYGALVMNSYVGPNPDFPSNVTIASADPSDPAIFTSVRVHDGSNLTFDGITFDYQYEAGDHEFQNDFLFSGVDNLTIKNSTFDGDLPEGVSDVADGFGYGQGLMVRFSNGVTVENNEVFNFHRAVGISESSDVVVSGNDVHSIRMDGLSFAEVNDITIEGNYIHDFRGSPNSDDHSDMIQFWTRGTDSPSSNINITGNTLDIGEGTPTQTIFIRNEVVDTGQAGEEFFYTDISITNNVIVNGHLHGISVGETNGLTIASNTLVHSDGGLVDGRDGSVEIPQINVNAAAKNVTIANNATAAINGPDGQFGWNVRNNVIIQDQDQYGEGFYDDVFVTSTLQLSDGQHRFLAAPDGPLATLNAGASITLSSSSSDPVEARFDVAQPEDQAAIRVFDATTTASELGALPQGTEFIWSFGDGTQASGLRVEHTYADGGNYDVTLTVRLPDGLTDQVTTPVVVAGPELVSLRSNGFTVSEAGVDTIIPAAVSGGISLTGNALIASIDHEHIVRLIETDEFEISMRLNSQSSNSAGEIFRIHGALEVKVDTNGEVTVLASQDDGSSVRLTTSSAGLNSIARQDVDINLKDGVLSLSLNGVVQDSANFVGTLQDIGERDLTFGSPWGQTNFNGSVSQFLATTHESDYNGSASSITLDTGVPEVVAVQQIVENSSQETPNAESLSEEDIASNVQPTPLDSISAFSIADSFDLEDIGVTRRIERAEVDFLPATDAFSIDFSLTGGPEADAGDVFRLHGSIHVYVQPDGYLRVRATSNDGQTTQLVSDQELFAETEINSVNITLENGILSLSIDGNPAVTGALDGNLGALSNHDLIFGNPWNLDNFTGTVAGFQISIPGEENQASADGDTTTLLANVFEEEPADGMLSAYASETQASSPSNTAASQGSDLPFETVDQDGMQFRSVIIDKLDAHENPFSISSLEET